MGETASKQKERLHSAECILRHVTSVSVVTGIGLNFFSLCASIGFLNSLSPLTPIDYWTTICEQQLR